MCDVFMRMNSRERMVVSTKSRGQGPLGLFTYFNCTQFKKINKTVYNGVNHDPQNSFVVD